MFPSQLEFVRHILEECEFVLKATYGISKDDMIKDEALKRAVIRSLEIMGEATKRLDADFKLQYPFVEWKKIAATRDVMIHDYFGVDYDIVWNIIQSKLPELSQSLQIILETNSGDI